LSRAKQKGTAWETRVVQYLQSRGFEGVERRVAFGAHDRGDINIGGLPVILECKNHKVFSLAEWVDETNVEKRNAAAEFGFAVFPRRNHAIGKAYALCDLEQLLNVLERIYGANGGQN